ncbi:uncharacterized protein OCT59_006217 [Rhizophagus irregularis]|uniref:uncharacterized protein n=1 Tax=Rhizophagus irregularis TaxID=588596 RepID=UPI003322F409|nr:hypothetical protein OCT59_006217 [Rhizophagus irregularis]
MLDRLPVEIVERIVAKIPDTDLIAASKVDSVWWRGGMGLLCEPPGKEHWKDALSEHRWGGDPWRLDWKWNDWTQQE